MQHKFLLRFIKQEMEKQKIPFKNNEEFFHLFLPDEPWDSYRSNISHWLSQGEDGTIRKRIFIEAINEKLGLKSEVWGASEGSQKEAVIKGVEKLKASLIEKEEMFSWLQEESLSVQEEAFLRFIETASMDAIEKELSLQKDLFQKTSSSQMFLIELFNLMYERGEYTFVFVHVFPYLLESYDNKIKSRKADIYASLPTPMYKEAFEILNSIKGESRAETIDLQTSAISNIRRERLSSKHLSKDELKILLARLIKCYTKIYTPKQEYSYYPGINLAYMVAMADCLFPNEELTQGYSLHQIYTDVQKSLQKGKVSNSKDENYYAGISDIEFQLLLNRQGMAQELEILLEEVQPTISQVNQTYRQMGAFFVEVLERFSDKSNKLTEYKKCLKIFNAYSSLS